MNPELYPEQSFASEESELSHLKTKLAEMKRERAALGDIDSVQLTDLDLDRMAELDETIITFEERLAELEPQLDKKHHQEDNIQEIDGIH